MPDSSPCACGASRELELLLAPALKVSSPQGEGTGRGERSPAASIPIQPPTDQELQLQEHILTSAPQNRARQQAARLQRRIKSCFKFSPPFPGPLTNGTRRLGRLKEDRGFLSLFPLFFLWNAAGPDKRFIPHKAPPSPTPQRRCAGDGGLLDGPYLPGRGTGHPAAPQQRAPTTSVSNCAVSTACAYPWSRETGHPLEGENQ